MGIRVMWDDDRKLALRYEFEEKWTWEDLKAAFAESHQLLATIDHQASTILDMRNTNMLPANAITRIGRLGIDEPGHPNHSRVTVIVGMTALAKGILSLATRTFKRLGENNDFHFVATLAEARTVIERERKSENV